MLTSVSKKEILDCDILYSISMEFYFVFKSFKNIISWSLQPVYIKNISSLTLKKLSESPSSLHVKYRQKKQKNKNTRSRGTNILESTWEYGIIKIDK